MLFMNRNDPNRTNDPNIEGVRDKANKPEPLYDKTDRNFQRQDQGPLEGNMHELDGKEDDLGRKEEENVIVQEHPKGSSSGEEKDIIV
jgi:hypothetical protein